MNIDEIRARAETYRHAEQCDAVYVEVYLSDVEQLLDALEAQQRELAAAVSDLTALCTAKDGSICDCCKNGSAELCLVPCWCNSTDKKIKWQWRGGAGKEQNDD